MVCLTLELGFENDKRAGSHPELSSMFHGRLVRLEPCRDAAAAPHWQQRLLPVRRSMLALLR